MKIAGRPDDAARFYVERWHQSELGVHTGERRRFLRRSSERADQAIVAWFRVLLGRHLHRFTALRVVSRNSGKCLELLAPRPRRHASAIEWICHGGPNRQWRLEPAGGGAFRIIARHSGQALDVFGASLDDVAPIIRWPVHGGATRHGPSARVRRLCALRRPAQGKAMDVEFARSTTAHE